MENVFNAQNIEFLMQGLFLTLKIALATCIISIVFGTFLAITKNYGDRLSKFLAACYIDIFRNTPLLLWMLAACFVLPVFFGQFPQAFWGTIGFSLYTSSVMAEIIRGGLNSIPKGQFEAASAIGMTHSQQMWHIILPQAIRNCLPSITNEFIVNIKDTSVLSIISVSELFFVGTTVASQTFQFFQTYFIISMIYLILTFSITRIFNFIEKKLEGPKNYNLMANQLQVEDPKETGFEHEQ